MKKCSVSSQVGVTSQSGGHVRRGSKVTDLLAWMVGEVEKKGTVRSAIGRERTIDAVKDDHHPNHVRARLR